MPTKVSPIPSGYRTITPYLIVKGGVRAIEYYKKAFGAKVMLCMMEPGGRVGHAELKIGDSYIMLSDEYPQYGFKAPKKGKHQPVSILIYVKNVDATVKKAVAAGAKLVRPVADQFYGDRTGGIADPFGHSWYVASHIEDVSPKEQMRRFKAMKKK